MTGAVNDWTAELTTGADAVCCLPIGSGITGGGTMTGAVNDWTAGVTMGADSVCWLPTGSGSAVAAGNRMVTLGASQA